MKIHGFLHGDCEHLYTSVHSPVCSSRHRYGKDDELGTLNRLTNDVVLEAAKEIKTGTRQVFMPSLVCRANP